MPRRKDSFARALADAEKRLEKALAEQAQCENHLVFYAQEIPRLKQIITSLGGNTETLEMQVRKALIPGKNDKIDVPPEKMTPEELAKWYTERDLSGVGSIVPEKPVAPAVSEDELLPEDFAEGKKV